MPDDRTIFVRNLATKEWWIGGRMRWGPFVRALRFTSLPSAAADFGGNNICPTCRRPDDVEFVEETRSGALTIVTE